MECCISCHIIFRLFQKKSSINFLKLLVCSNNLLQDYLTFYNRPKNFMIKRTVTADMAWGVVRILKAGSTSKTTLCYHRLVISVVVKLRKLSTSAERICFTLYEVNRQKLTQQLHSLKISFIFSLQYRNRRLCLTFGWPLRINPPVNILLTISAQSWTCKLTWTELHRKDKNYTVLERRM